MPIYSEVSSTVSGGSYSAKCAWNYRLKLLVPASGKGISVPLLWGCIDAGNLDTFEP